jgi:hypothetical protein
MATVLKGRYKQGDDGLRTVKTDSDGRKHRNKVRP